MASRKRKCALVFACLFAVVFVSCVVWMSVNGSHACREEQCPICSQLETMGSVFRRICSAGVAVQCVAVALMAGASVFGAATLKGQTDDTLVTLKVKLSNGRTEKGTRGRTA